MNSPKGRYWSHSYLKSGGPIGSHSRLLEACGLRLEAQVLTHATQSVSTFRLLMNASHKARNPSVLLRCFWNTGFTSILVLHVYSFSLLDCMDIQLYWFQRGAYGIWFHVNRAQQSICLFKLEMPWFWCYV